MLVTAWWRLLCVVGFLSRIFPYFSQRLGRGMNENEECGLVWFWSALTWLYAKVENRETGKQKN